MSLRSFTVCASLLLASFAVGGCYDLSDPSGPRPEDFEKNQVGTTVDDQTAADPQDEDNCPDGTCNAVPVKSTTTLSQPLVAEAEPTSAARLFAGK